MTFVSKKMDVELTEQEQTLVCETAELLDLLMTKMNVYGYETVEGGNDLSIDDIKIFISLLDHLGAGQVVIY